MAHRAALLGELNFSFSILILTNFKLTSAVKDYQVMRDFDLSLVNINDSLAVSGDYHEPSQHIAKLTCASISCIAVSFQTHRRWEIVVRHVLSGMTALQPYLMNETASAIFGHI